MKTTRSNHIPELAPERTKREKVAFVILAICLGLLALHLKDKALIPWIKDFTTTESGSSYFGLPRTTVFTYLVFVGIPGFSALITSVLAWRGYKILKSKQIPPPGERVFRKTLIRKGRIATIAGYAHFIPTILLLCLTFWGIAQAEHFIHYLRS